MRTQTWVIVVKLKAPQEVSPSRTAFPARNPLVSHNQRISFKSFGGEIKHIVQIKAPTIVIPDGAENVEVIPILGPTVIHGKNFKRKVKP